MNDKEYAQWVAELKHRIKSAQIKAAVKVNRELINLYWSIGKDIVERKAEDTLGGNFYKRISNDLQLEFPDMKGFSERNIFICAPCTCCFRLSKPNCHNLWQSTRKCHNLWQLMSRKPFASFLGDTFDTSLTNICLRKKRFSMCRKHWKTVGAELY